MVVEDQTGRKIAIGYPPKRIISLVPSQTELICDLGLTEKLVGRTKYCVHPDNIAHVPAVGGTKKQVIHRIEALNPDIIIGNKEENTKGVIEKLQQKYPVWLSDVRSIAEAINMIAQIGKITGATEKAECICNQVRSGFNGLKNKFKGNAAYLIWEKPTMAVGHDTFIDSVITHLGFTNVIRQPRYPEVSIEAISAGKPDYLWLSSEPFPYSEKHVQSYAQALPKTTVKIVDGEMFSWYGSRLLKSIAYFESFRPD